MKKLLKAWAVLAAMAMFGTNFIGCSSGDDGPNGDGLPSGGVYQTVVPVRLVPTAESTAGEVKLDNVVQTSIQAAFDAISDTAEHTITLASGTYDLGTDQIVYKGGATIHIKGLGSAEYGTDVLIKTARDNLSSEESRSAFYADGACNITLENLTIQNTNNKIGDAQFEVVGYAGSGTLAAYNCSFLSHQDTIRTTGKAWFYKCYIEGDVDFLWMEEAGSVALYENCRLRAVRDRVASDGTCNAYFTAPRMSVADEKSYYKGLVIIDSAFEVEDGVTAYLGRNPWNKSGSIYNNVSIVRSTLAGKIVGSFKNAGNANSAIKFTGFHTDSYFAADAYTVRYSSTMVNNEFAGRNNIINRYWDGEISAMAKASSIWDVSALATKLNWTVKEDTSKNILDSETPVNVYDYSFVGATDSGDGTWQSADGNIILKPQGFRSDVHGVTLDSSATMTVKVDTMCKVTFMACQYGIPYVGKVTIKSEGEADVVKDFNIDIAAVDGGATGCVFYTGKKPAMLVFEFSGLTGQAYLHGINIREYAEFNQATSITIDGKSEVLVDSTIQLSATISPANVTLKAVTWTSSDEEVALVSKKGLVQGLKAGTTEITCSATDGSGVVGKKTITVKSNSKLPVVGTTYFYNLKGGVGNPYFSEDTFFQIFGKADNGGHGIETIAGSYIKVKVAGNVEIDLHNCRYDNAADIIATNSNGEVVGSVHIPGQEKYKPMNEEGATEEEKAEFKADDFHNSIFYVGPADTLTLTYKNATGSSYLHDITIKPLVDITPVTSISVKATDDATQVAKGAKLQLLATVTPDTATSKSVRWSSSDATKATVDSEGVVTGIATTESVTITATAIDGSGVKGSIDLKVFMPAPTLGAKYAWNLTGGVGFPYTSEDTFLAISGSGNDNGSHGLNLGTGASVKLDVAGSCVVTIQTCCYDKASSVSVTDIAGNAVATVTIPAGTNSAPDPTTQTFAYNGDATTLNLEWTGNSYVHGIEVMPMIATDRFVDFRTVCADFATTGNPTTVSKDFVDFYRMYYKGSQHGAWFYNNTTISFAVAGACTVYLARNPYNGASYTISGVDSSKLSATTVDAKVDEADGTIGADETDLSLNAKNPSFDYTGTVPVVITLSVTGESGSNYLSAIQVKY